MAVSHALFPLAVNQSRGQSSGGTVELIDGKRAAISKCGYLPLRWINSKYFPPALQVRAISALSRTFSEKARISAAALFAFLTIIVFLQLLHCWKFNLECTFLHVWRADRSTAVITLLIRSYRLDKRVCRKHYGTWVALFAYFFPSLHTLSLSVSLASKLKTFLARWDKIKCASGRAAAAPQIFVLDPHFHWKMAITPTSLCPFIYMFSHWN